MEEVSINVSQKEMEKKFYRLSIWIHHYTKATTHKLGPLWSSNVGINQTVWVFATHILYENV